MKHNNIRKVHFFCKIGNLRVTTDLTSSLVSSANLFSHLYQHIHQAGFLVQLLPQCAAAAVPQGSLDFTEPALVVGITVDFLQKPVGIFKTL